MQDSVWEVFHTINFKDNPVLRATFIIETLQYSGFDRGHLAAAGNHKQSQDTCDETFYLSNMAPQVCFLQDPESKFKSSKSSSEGSGNPGRTEAEVGLSLKAALS